MKTIQKLLIITLIALSGAISIFNFTASAQYAVYNSKDQKNAFSAKAGDTINSSVTIQSASSQKITLKIYAVDGTKTDAGSFAALTSDKEQKTIGKWTTIDTTNLTLEPKAEQVIKYTIKIPADIPPGVYTGAIAVENAEGQSGAVGQGQTGAIIKTRVILPVYIEVPGKKIYDIKLKNFTHELRNNNHAFVLNIQNDGNVATTTKISLKVENWDGTTDEIPERSLMLYKGESANFPIFWDKKPYLGFYTVKAKLSYFEKDIFTGQENAINSEVKELSFSVVPWFHISIVVFVLLILIALLLYKYIRLCNAKKKSVPYTVKEGDTITGISQKNGLNWKLLAKLNKLKAPYTLSVGQKLLLPTKKK